MRDCGNRSFLGKLVTKFHEELFVGAVLVGKRNEKAFTVLRWYRCQRKHVTHDDVFLDRGQIEISSGIFQRNLRMGKAVEFIELNGMPVIKEIVVKKRPAHELVFLELEGEPHGHGKSRLRYCQDVIIAGTCSVLDILTHRLQFPAFQDRRRQGIKYNVVLILSLQKNSPDS